MMTEASNHTEPWRILIEPANGGANNMAIDEAILEAVGRGEAPPTLRLYRWQPACLSLGYAQPAYDADLERIDEHGWHVVRRLTGGRAILHTDELTYSVTLPQGHTLVTGTIVDSYRRISSALLAALHYIGLDAHADKRNKVINPANAAGPVCFEVPSDYEITANSKKLIGSAQVRRHGGTLQHGSLPLGGDITRICEALAFPDEATRQKARERVLQRATTLAEALGRSVSWDEAAEAVVQAFRATFDVQPQPGTLTAAELRRVGELCLERYATSAWTLSH